VISRLEHQADIKEDPTLKPIVIRLSGHVHVNDRIALMEIGRQLISQNGPSNLSLPQLEDNEDEIESDAEDDEAPLRTRFASLMVRQIRFRRQGGFADCRAASPISHVFASHHHVHITETNHRGAGCL